MNLCTQHGIMYSIEQRQLINNLISRKAVVTQHGILYSIEQRQLISNFKKISGYYGLLGKKSMFIAAHTCTIVRTV